MNNLDAVRKTHVVNGAVCLVAKSCLTLYPSQLLCPWGFSRQDYWSGLPCPPPGNLPNPGIEPKSSTLQAESFLSEPPRKPKNTGVGSLSLLQETFPIQEPNWGLWHCRQILYQLSYPRSPKIALRQILTSCLLPASKDEHTVVGLSHVAGSGCTVDGWTLLTLNSGLSCCHFFGQGGHCKYDARRDLS